MARGEGLRAFGSWLGDTVQGVGQGVYNLASGVQGNVAERRMARITGRQMNRYDRRYNRTERVLGRQGARVGVAEATGTRAGQNLASAGFGLRLGNKIGLGVGMAPPGMTSTYQPPAYARPVQKPSFIEEYGLPLGIGLVALLALKGTK